MRGRNSPTAPKRGILGGGRPNARLGAVPGAPSRPGEGADEDEEPLSGSEGEREMACCSWLVVVWLGVTGWARGDGGAPNAGDETECCGGSGAAPP